MQDTFTMREPYVKYCNLLMYITFKKTFFYHILIIQYNSYYAYSIFVSIFFKFDKSVTQLSRTRFNKNNE